MLTHIVRHIFLTARPTNFTLRIQMEDDDPHQPQAPWPPRSRSKGHVISLGRFGPILYLCHEAGGGILCRPNPTATLIVLDCVQLIVMVTLNDGCLRCISTAFLFFICEWSFYLRQGSCVPLFVSSLSACMWAVLF